MEITSLKLVNFRNFDNLELNFSNNKNIIIGDNGVGKTNIVEAIFVLALTKSFRTNDDMLMVKNDKNYFKIEGDVKSNFINNYKITYQEGVKTVKINNNKINKFSDYISNINVILFSINDLKLIKDTPSTRRKLINLEISELDNNYIKYLNYYNKILKQRTSYLKTLYGKTINYNYLNIIDSQLKEYLLNLYAENINKDINLGSTQIGIHKDDFIFNIDGNDIKNFASEGQQKNCVIAFKLAELEIFKEKTGEYPILILDDLFSELDIKKINKILNYISEDIETFITTTDLKKIKKCYLKSSKIFEFKNDEIKEKYYE